MKIQRYIVRSMDQNVYFYYNEKTREAVVIDPGGDAKNIIDFVEKNELDVKAILLTHGHGDHIGAIPELKKKYDWPIATHACEVAVLEDEKLNFSKMMGDGIGFTPDILFEDGDTFNFGEGNSLKVIHTPGHTIGGVCFYNSYDKVLFSGDTLFLGSIGRTDFPNPESGKIDRPGCGYPMSENFNKISQSISEKLFILPDDTMVFPGHSEGTSIGYEKKNNPFIRV